MNRTKKGYQKLIKNNFKNQKTQKNQKLTRRLQAFSIIQFDFMKEIFLKINDTENKIIIQFNFISEIYLK